MIGRGRRVGGWRATTRIVQLMRASAVIDSMVSASVTKDAEIDSRKPNRPTLRLMMRAPSVATVKPAASSPVSPWPRQQCRSQDEPGHGVEQEQRPIGGDLAVSLLPQVEMDVPDPGQECHATQP